MSLPLKPYLSQVAYFGTPDAPLPAPDLPGLVDCAIGDRLGFYAMPSGDQGYKAGIDYPLRPLEGGSLGEDLNRSEDPDRTEAIRARIERDLKAVPPHVLATQVCTWTHSGDGDFIIGRTHPTVVLACGDCGEGFKYAAFMGEYLTEIIAGNAGDSEFQSHWDPFRFGSEGHHANRSAHADLPSRTL
jgi:glycine/D-amino acid oxidase-like deaminating enzyme